MKTKSFEQVLEESSPAVKKAYKKELKKVNKKKVTKTTGLPKPTEEKLTKKERLMLNKLANKVEWEDTEDTKSRFADKDFDFNKFPSQRNNKQLLKEMGLKEEIVFDGKNWTKHGKKLAVTPKCLRVMEGNRHNNFLGEIEGEPVINCTKWQFMCLVLGLALLLTYKMYHG